MIRSTQSDPCTAFNWHHNPDLEFLNAALHSGQVCEVLPAVALSTGPTHCFSHQHKFRILLSSCRTKTTVTLACRCFLEKIFLCSLLTIITDEWILCRAIIKVQVSRLTDAHTPVMPYVRFQECSMCVIILPLHVTIWPRPFKLTIQTSPDNLFNKRWSIEELI